MLNMDRFISSFKANNHSKWATKVREVIYQKESNMVNGHLPKWNRALELLPKKISQDPICNEAAISIKNINFTKQERLETEQALKTLSPWRKGPFIVDDIFIDSEWQSNLKWSRVNELIDSLEGKTILDVGCGNGYYSLRMLGEGAKLVVGIDPSILFMKQFAAITHFMKPASVFLLPLKLDELPDSAPIFDTVFSMGVLYHQRSPLSHLNQLYNVLNKNGELILETIIYPGLDTYKKNDAGRYAQMRNVWSLPNITELCSWLNEVGFKDIKKGRINITTINEQRSTDWMTSFSLSNALNANNSKLTIEGFPAPHRIVISCKK